MARRFTGRRLVVATHNRGKADEIRGMLRTFPVEIVSAAETISTPKPDSMLRISPALPRLCVATTSFGRTKRRAIRPA